MSAWKKLLATSAAAGGGLNVEDVFSTYLYTGDGTSSQTITNDIDLSGEGGLVWLKSRATTSSNWLYDTERGVTKELLTNSAGAQSTESIGLTAFNTDGFTFGSRQNQSAYSDSVSWTFRKAPKFFTSLTYSGTGSAQNISHDLGSVPGCIMVKRTDDTDNWAVYHRGMDASAPQDYYMQLNTTDGRIDNTARWNDTAPTSTQFTVGTAGTVNASGGSYVAYLFAHNDGDGDFGLTGDQDIIKCGSFTGSSSGALINLGFEPQWVMWKKINSAGSWFIADSMRFFTSKPPNNGQVKDLKAESSAAEVGPNYYIGLDSQGFWEDGLGTSDSYIYIAIRKGPMAVPTAATDVFDVRAGFTGTDRPQFPSGFVTDMGLLLRTSGANPRTSARLIQGQMLKTNLTDAETANSAYVFDYQNGWLDSGLDTTYYGYSWKRAPNYFDVVAYTGNGLSNVNTVSHNLGVAPEMIWTKRRDSTNDWQVYHSGLNGGTNPEQYSISLNTTGTQQNRTYWNDTAPTSTTFQITDAINGNGDPYIAYLFASLDGVSKVGSYTGTGSALNIDCGFSSGARFVMIKRTDVVGGWYVWDSERGIVAGNDPFLFLNDSQSEFTTYDALDPYSAGFTVNAQLGGYNASGSSYIFYAIA